MIALDGVTFAPLPHPPPFHAQMQDELAEVRAEVQSLHEELTSAKEENVRKERETAEVNEKAGRIEAELGIAREDGTALKEELFEAREEVLCIGLGPRLHALWRVALMRPLMARDGPLMTSDGWGPGRCAFR